MKATVGRPVAITGIPKRELKVEELDVNLSSASRIPKRELKDIEAVVRPAYVYQNPEKGVERANLTISIDPDERKESRKGS